MPLRQQHGPPPTFRQREHYLVFGPIHFTCTYTERACETIAKHTDRCWQRKQKTTKQLYFPTESKPRTAPAGRQYETWPQIYFWNVDLQTYQYVGGYTDLVKRYGTAVSYSKNKNEDCNACRG